MEVEQQKRIEAREQVERRDREQWGATEVD